MGKHITILSLDDKNHWAHKEPPISEVDIKRLARSILSRAIADLRGTADYSKPLRSFVTGTNNVTEAIAIGEEVRRWMLDESEDPEVFSFQSVCELSGYDHRTILRKLNKYIVPKNRFLSNEDVVRNKIISICTSCPDGIPNYLLVGKLRRTFHPTMIRLTVRRMREEDILFTTRRRTGTRETLMWHINQTVLSQSAEGKNVGTAQVL